VQKGGGLKTTSIGSDDGSKSGLHRSQSLSRNQSSLIVVD
jgi:hypothetical protein